MTAKESGEDSNLGADVELTVASALSTGFDSTMKAASDGISGGINWETDEEYLSRIMAFHVKPRATKAFGDVSRKNLL